MPFTGCDNAAAGITNGVKFLKKGNIANALACLPLNGVLLALDSGERLPLDLGDHVLDQPPADDVSAAAQHRPRRGATVVVLCGDGLHSIWFIRNTSNI